MANNVGAFYQVLVAAANEASQALVGTTKMLDSVFRDVRPESATIGQTINIALPGQANAAVSDIGVGDFNLNDVTAGTASVVFSNHPAGGFIIRNFEQYNSPQDIRNGFLDSYIKAVAEQANSTIAGLVTSANFNKYPAIKSGTPGIIDAGSITQAMGYLSAGKIPVTDLGNFFLTVNPFAYFQMAGNTFWTANTQVGDQLAGMIRKGAQLGQQFGADIGYDQQLPTVNTSGAGTVTTTTGSTAVVGSSTTLTNYAAGQFLIFGTDAIPYQIASVTDATHLVLAAPYLGTGGSGVAYKSMAFTNFLYHRNAIALGLRPLPEPDGRVVDYTYIDWKGLPIRVQLGWNQIKDGWCVTVDAGLGQTVFRPDHGIIITS